MVSTYIQGGPRGPQGIPGDPGALRGPTLCHFISISLIFNENLIKESLFQGSSWPGLDLTFFWALAGQAQISLIFN